MPRILEQAPEKLAPIRAAGVAPPYAPWKSFESFVGELKKSAHPPAIIDGSVMPSNMAGGMRTLVRSALKFLELTDSAGNVSPGFAEVISAHGTSQWPVAVKEHVVSAYDLIIGDLPIDRATSPQLEAKFKAKGVAAGQMVEKTVRFYLHALKSAGIKYSTYLSNRNEKSSQRKPRSAKANPNKTDRPQSGETLPDPLKGKGLLEFPLHFGDKTTGKICVPLDLDENDMALFDATVGVVKAYCARKKAGSK